MGKLICYTAITGEYDELDTTLAQANPGWECWLLTDGDPPAELHGWRHRRLPYSYYSPRRQARRAKILAHEMWPDADVTVWMDGNLTLRESVKLNHLLDHFCPKEAEFVTGGLNTDPKWSAAWQGCAYLHGEACADLGLDDRQVIERQLERYRGEGFPRHFGLFNTRMVVRRHCKAVEELERAWWDELLSNSCRDQIALPYALWKCPNVRAETFAECEETQAPYKVRDHKGLRVQG